MQMNPASPGLSFHKLDKCKDKNFWSIRASDDIRVIVHKTNNSLMLCYVDHHALFGQVGQKYSASAVTAGTLKPCTLVEQGKSLCQAVCVETSPDAFLASKEWIAAIHALGLLSIGLQFCF